MIDLSNKDSFDGAIDAINIILASRHRNIKSKNKRASDEENANQNEENKLKMPKNVTDIDVDEEEAEQDAADQKEAETEESRQTRIKAIANELNDTEQIKKDLEDIKQDLQQKKSEQIRADKEAADTALRKNSLENFDEFEKDFYRAIKSQVKLSKTPDETYSKINATYAGSDLLMPGLAYSEKKEIPIINVYFDKSGSLSQSDINRGKDAISVINSLQKQKRVKYSLFWFADNVVSNPSDVKGATHAFPKILTHIQETKANNVIIFTDSDFDFQSGDLARLPYLELSGCVWWIWAHGKRASEAFRHVQSKHPNNTFQYEI